MSTTEPRTVHELDAFTARLSFQIDAFQRRACESLEDGRGVLVCAPTGAGKTVVGEFAVHLALAEGGKCFYTTPIKALSNQKYHDLLDVHGEENVGLLTGDNSINSAAPVVVMTTEVLRNMIYADSAALQGLSHVVMDEVHFLADRFRGAVWEEVILGLDPSVRVASLSATVSNAEEFGDWITTVRGDTDVVVDEHRPVPLHQHMLVAGRMFELFERRRRGSPDGGRRVNSDLTRYLRHRMLGADATGGYQDRVARDRRNRGRGGVNRPRMISTLDADGLLPAIDFIFSRKGCDAAVEQCLRSDLHLLDPEDVAKVDEVVDRHLTELTPADADVLGVDDWRWALRRGFAAHHAGLLPTFRQAVEELFTLGLVKVVFATETLALGINMPARSVVLERLVKYNGESHVDLTPGEYTQLTGRAGRRGIDVEGHAVVVWTPEVIPERVAGLAGARTFPLRSSFAPEYNMAMNLIDRLGVDGSRALLRRSFAQFQTDRSVVGQARKLDDATRLVRKADAELAAAAARHKVDPERFVDYVRIREEIRRRERSQKFLRRVDGEEAVSAALSGLDRGDVVTVESGRHRGRLAVVLEAAWRGPDPRPLVLCEDRWVGRVAVADFVNPPAVLGSVHVPKGGRTRSAHGRREVLSALQTADISRPRGRVRKRAAPVDHELEELRRQLRSHPVHKAHGLDELFRMSERRARVAREAASLEEAVHSRTSQLENDFDAVVGVLVELNYLEDDGAGSLRVTPTGSVLRRIYSESDLLVAECIRAGVWTGLTPADLAAVVSSVLFTARRESFGGVDSMPGNAALRDAVTGTMAVWEACTRVEDRHGVVQTREPDTGFCAAVSSWASGRGLRDALAAASSQGTLLSPGDFVRWNRQVIDLLEQIRLGVDPADPLAATAKRAVASIRRGVVAAELD